MRLGPMKAWPLVLKTVLLPLLAENALARGIRRLMEAERRIPKPSRQVTT